MEPSIPNIPSPRHPRPAVTIQSGPNDSNTPRFALVGHLQPWSQPLPTAGLFPLHGLPFPDANIDGIQQQEAFRLWLLPLSKMHSSANHGFFFFFACESIACSFLCSVVSRSSYTHESLFSHLPVVGRLGFYRNFYFLYFEAPF